MLFAVKILEKYQWRIYFFFKLQTKLATLAENWISSKVLSWILTVFFRTFIFQNMFQWLLPNFEKYLRRMLFLAKLLSLSFQIYYHTNLFTDFFQRFLSEVSKQLFCRIGISVCFWCFTTNKQSGIMNLSGWSRTFINW